MTESDGRYDRQLRIWGAHGQRRFESSRICVINSSATSSETLKNLVLGGLHSFTLIDDTLLTDADFGNNYLVDPASLHQPRAEVVAKLLLEFNPSISANVLIDSFEEAIKNHPDFLKDYSLIITTQLTPSRVRSIVEKCEKCGVPLLNVRSYGLVGYIQLFFDEFCIVESKPDDQVPDLRLWNPWSKLLEFAKSLNFDELEDVQHSHVPFIVILIKALEHWRTSKSDTLPSDKSQKDEFKSIVNGLKRSKQDPYIEEENFDEALKSAFQVWTPYEIPKNVREMLDDSKTLVQQNSSEFWILVHALKNFVSENGVLPLNGAIPDMTSTTEYYLTLQEIYKKKAEADIHRMSVLVKETLQTLDRPSHSISLQSISLFCKNARNLRLIRSRPRWFLEDPELITNLRRKTEYQTFSLGMMVEAAEKFYEKHARFPGVLCGEDWLQDIELLMQLLDSSIDLSGLDKELKSELQTIAHEICRWGGAEFHAVASIMGGMASQEAIKILTQQFVPLSGSLFYNGINSTTSTHP